jgi:hypothetical protein
MKRYRDRKAIAKSHFNDVGGSLEDVPKGMLASNWEQAVQFFNSEAHIKRSAANVANRQAQQIVNRGGTASYGSMTYENVMFCIYIILYIILHYIILT